MRRPFIFLNWLVSLLLAFLGALFMFGMIDNVNWTSEHIFWGGAFFAVVFLCGFAGFQISLLLMKRHFRIIHSPRWVAALIVCAVLMFAVGAGGQALFMLSSQETTINSTVDIVLLLDASGSMDTYGYSHARTDAATQFVDTVSEDTYMQAVSFASIVLDSTELLPMDVTGKQTLKGFIDDIDSVGMTDFDLPIVQAIDTLSSAGRQDSSKAIILLTDGEGEFSASTSQALLDANIRLFSIRIDASGSDSQEKQALIDLSERSGGFDTRLVPGADGSIDATELLEAFQSAFEASTQREIVMRQELLACSDDVTLYQFVIRLATFVICSVIFGIGYFAQFKIGMVICNAISGAVAAVLVTISGGGYFLCAVFISALLAAAYTAPKWNGGDTLDV